MIDVAHVEVRPRRQGRLDPRETAHEMNTPRQSAVRGDDAPSAGRETWVGCFGGGTGKVMLSQFGLEPTALALQSDGKIIVAGNLQVARFNTDGSLDTSFGTQGYALVVTGDVAGGCATPTINVPPNPQH